MKSKQGLLERFIDGTKKVGEISVTSRFMRKLD